MFSQNTYSTATGQVDVTRFDELEETHAEVRMKQQLWESLKSWDVETSEWVDKKFDELNPEEISQVFLTIYNTYEPQVDV